MNFKEYLVCVSERYLTFAKRNQDQHYYNRPMREFCGSPYFESSCYEPEMISEMCDLYPVQILKTTRIRLRALRRMLTKADQ